MLRQYDEDQRIALAFIGSCSKGIAHNINTPLSAVLGRAEMLQMRLEKIKAAGAQLTADDLERCLKDARLIFENSTRISGIIKTVMKNSMTAEYLQPQPVRVDSVMHDTLELMTADMFYKHQVEKEICIQEEMPGVQGVALHFALSFLELIDNSLRALQDAQKKHLAVSVAADDRDIHIEVRDTGCGIAGDLQQTLLEQLNGPVPVTGSAPGGLQRVRRLLAPYCARYEIRSAPDNTLVAVRLPIRIA